MLNFYENVFNLLRLFLKFPLSYEHICIRRQFNDIYSFIQERTFILCCSPIQSDLSIKSTGANDTQFTAGGPSTSLFMHVLSFLSARYSAGRVEISWLTKPRCIFPLSLPFLLPHVRFSLGRNFRLGCRLLVDVLFVRFDFPPDRHRASSSFAALARNFNFDPASRARAFYTCRFLPPLPLAPRLTLFSVGGPSFACRARFNLENAISWHYRAVSLSRLFNYNQLLMW